MVMVPAKLQGSACMNDREQICQDAADEDHCCG
jgi:hypothetical protein